MATWSDANETPLWRKAAKLSLVIAAAALACYAFREVGLRSLFDDWAPTESGDTAFLTRRAGEQHIFIMRHGDKYSSYPDCPGSPARQPEDVECFDAAIMGDNPPLTPCGMRQAELAAEWLVGAAGDVGGLQQLVVSPFARTLMTALPLARRLGLRMQVDPALSEAMQPEGPFRGRNVLLRAEVTAQLDEIAEVHWDTQYGAVPVATPENVTLYNARVAAASEKLRARFPPVSGNLAVITHATTAVSLAFGLCRDRFAGPDAQCTGLATYLEAQEAIAPTGVIHVVLGEDGRCRSLGQTQNVAFQQAQCGLTEPFKCMFSDNPTWYWNCPLGQGPEQC